MLRVPEKKISTDLRADRSQVLRVVDSRGTRSELSQFQIGNRISPNRQALPRGVKKKPFVNGGATSRDVRHASQMDVFLPKIHHGQNTACEGATSPRLDPEGEGLPGLAQRTTDARRLPEQVRQNSHQILLNIGGTPEGSRSLLQASHLGGSRDDIFLFDASVDQLTSQAKTN